MTARPLTIIIPHGFEPNYTAGFVKGVACHDVPLCVISDDVVHGQLVAAGIPAVNLRGAVNEDRAFLKKTGNLLRYYVAVLWFVARHRNAVVHFTGIFRNCFVLFEGIIFHGLLRLLSRQYVYTAHNVLPHNKDRSRFHRLVYRLIYAIPHAVIVHTRRAQQQLMEEFNVPARRITVMSMGVNEEVPVTGLSAAEARRRLQLKNDPVILFFGKIDEYKGVDLLVQAFALAEKQMPAARLVIAGAFRSPAYRRQVLSLIETLPSRDRVVLHEGHIPNEQVELFFKAADVVVLPYRKIYQSGLLFLALRFDTPLIATDVGAMSEFIDERSGILVPPGDVEALAAALHKFFTGREHFSASALASRASRYKWENVCGVLAPIYG